MGTIWERSPVPTDAICRLLTQYPTDQTHSNRTGPTVLERRNPRKFGGSSGGGGIRTRGPVLSGLWFSRPAQSSTLPPLLGCECVTRVERSSAPTTRPRRMAEGGRGRRPATVQRLRSASRSGSGRRGRSGTRSAACPSSSPAGARAIERNGWMPGVRGPSRSGRTVREPYAVLPSAARPEMRRVHGRRAPPVSRRSPGAATRPRNPAPPRGGTAATRPPSSPSAASRRSPSATSRAAGRGSAPGSPCSGAR